MQFGKFCNQKYSSEMENIFEFIDDFSKRLARPLKDLDDTRFAMAALREIRENEIRIDMAIGPIEVLQSSYLWVLYVNDLLIIWIHKWHHGEYNDYNQSVAVQF